MENMPQNVPINAERHSQRPSPRILIVEDNQISTEFFSAALASLNAHLDFAQSHAHALQAYSQPHAHYDVWLIDLHLPDGDGHSLAKKLKQREPRTHAIGHTALSAMQVTQHTEFITILHKPLTPEKLRTQVKKYLPVTIKDSDVKQRAIWDDISGLAALHGRKDHLAALRQLFMAELAQTKKKLIEAMTRRDRSALQSLLHTLQASCGFVGAHQLGEATRKLQNDPNDSDAQHHVITAIQRTQWFGLP